MAVQLDAKKRTETGKGPAGRLRRSGLIPSIIYGQAEHFNIAVDQKEFNKLTHRITRSTIINLNVEGKNYDVMIKDYEKDYIKDRFIHIDFYELNKDKVAVFSIPFKFNGNPIGVKDGGTFVTHMLDVKVECLPGDIIPQLEIEIGHLNIGDSIHISDIQFNTKYRVITHLDEVVAHVAGKEKEEVVLETAAAATVTPEADAAAAGTALPEADKEKEKK